MDFIWQLVISCTAAYLLGSISFAVLVAKRHGVDIFKEGSCNPGATNVKRVLGKKAGNTVFAFDVFKGILAVTLPWLLGPSENTELLQIGGLIFAILGHSFSVFMKFRGGKGVATTVGGLLILAPIPVLIGIGIWIVTFYSLRYVSLASILLGVSLPISTYFLNGSTFLLGFCILIAVLLVVRHKSNIVRLMNGTENKFVKKS